MAAGVALVLLSPGARAAELLMFRRDGCPWCLRFDQAIGPVYPSTDIGRRVPLRHLDLDRDPKPDVQLTSPVRYTPTFVLVSARREVGRIQGYPGEDFFWALLEALVRKLPAPS